MPDTDPHANDPAPDEPRLDAPDPGRGQTPADPDPHTDDPAPADIGPTEPAPADEPPPADPNPRARQRLRALNRGMVLAWRAGFGPTLNVWPSGGGRIMVIVHTGRVSGLRRRTPVNYAEVDGAVYCVAGFGPASDWYRNILVDPRVELWLPDRRVTGLAEDVGDRPDRVRLIREVLIASGFAAPLVGIPVRRLDDAQLAELTAEYQLVRIVPDGPATGPDGPGQPRRVWPALAAATAAFLVLRRLRRSRR